MTTTRPRNFEDFWSHFVSSHTDARVRWAHVAALGLGIVGLGAAVQRRTVFPLALGAGAFAALAILSHPLFTESWPENFGEPLWATRAFVRLCVRTVTGSINAEVTEIQRPVRDFHETFAI